MQIHRSDRKMCRNLFYGSYFSHHRIDHFFVSDAFISVINEDAWEYLCFHRETLLMDVDLDSFLCSTFQSKSNLPEPQYQHFICIQ
jgi:hypothetical protein